MTHLISFNDPMSDSSNLVIKAGTSFDQDVIIEARYNRHLTLNPADPDETKITFTGPDGVSQPLCNATEIYFSLRADIKERLDFISCYKEQKMIEIEDSSSTSATVINIKQRDRDEPPNAIRSEIAK